MSVIGLDVGNLNCVVGMVWQQGIGPDLQHHIKIAQNESSSYETPALVAFNNKQRLIGSTASLSPPKDPCNIISQVKRLIGLKYDDPQVQEDIKRLPYKVTEDPDDGSPQIHVSYLGNDMAFKPTHIMAMILSNLKSIAEQNLEGNIKNCVIAVPVYFTHAQRQAYLDAAVMAGLRPLRLMHETAATALAYGIYQKVLPAATKDPRYVVFVDIGHSSMQVCVVAFKWGQGKVLGYGFDRSLGGRDFDAVLFDYVAEKFEKENKIKIESNHHKVKQRLWTACEKLKRVLSTNPDASYNIECLMEEKDACGVMTRKHFEQLASSLLNRVQGPCKRALEMAKLTVEKIYAIELVGSGSRIPAIFNNLSQFFHKEPGRTMNASECVARGCTLQCAIYTPTFEVRDFKLHDCFPCPIKVSWEGQVTAVDGTAGEKQCNEATVFKMGDNFPNTKILYFFRSNKFDIDVSYILDGMDSARKFTISPSNYTKVENPKIKVKISLDRHGMVSVSSAFPEHDGVPANRMARNSDSMKNSKMKTGSKWNNVPEKGVVVEGLDKAMKQEEDLQQQDRKIEEIKRLKNDLEAYLYCIKSKLTDNDQKYSTDPEIKCVLQQFQKTEEWLSREGADETKEAYEEKLLELHKLWNSFEDQFKEEHTKNKGTSGANQSTQCMQNSPVSDFEHTEECSIEKSPQQADSTDRSQG